MKLYLCSLFAIALVACASSCSEINPLGTTNPIDTTTSVQQKNILIEDITGVRCPNCPEGHEITEQIHDAHPGRVELVAVHTGDLSSMFPYSFYDFEIPATGAAIDNYLGPADFYPKGSIDRVQYDSQFEVLVGRDVWTGLAEQRLLDTLQVEVNLSKTYNAATRGLSLDVDLNYLSDIADAQKITVYITESGIVDAQEFPDYIDTFYVHNNVLRAVLTDATGDVITESTPLGTELSRTYNYTLPNGWNPENCRAIVFVSRFTSDVATGKEVLQVAGIDIN